LKFIFDSIIETLNSGEKIELRDLGAFEYAKGIQEKDETLRPEPQ
jgi:nucleoid DNA-binding protein